MIFLEIKNFYFELVTKNLNLLLSQRIVQLERNAVNNAQYHRCKSPEINAVPASISNEALETSVCKALSLTVHDINPDHL